MVNENMLLVGICTLTRKGFLFSVFFSKVTWITTKPLDAKSCRGFARSDQLGDAKCRNVATLARDCLEHTQHQIEEQEITGHLS